MLSWSLFIYLTNTFIQLELNTYENEVKQLRILASQNEELVKTCQQQGYELEQVKAQVGELQNKQKQAAAVMAATTAANTQAEECSKVEIRNLQNALDSSKTELTVCRSELAEHKTKLAEQEQQAKELRAREEDLQKQIEEQKAKNNVSTVPCFHWFMFDTYNFVLILL